MAQIEESNGAFRLAILILFVLTLAGGIIAAYSTNGSAFYPGLMVGFLIGIAVLMTVDYAAIQFRRD